ncbi:SDR family NAD(P)-dependent oxidoreductase [Microbacterium sp. A93]|uniref:SDR family NAD(P)-dependent oxidoreductase n=1 Tax=Microbacterium sp. A93 TaxID=3450716 RepID=UPI003F42D129
MSGRLDGKIAIITGAAQGMGEAHAERFVREGAQVVLTDLQTKQGEALAARLGQNALFIEHDVTDEQAWTEVVRAAEARYGTVNVLINNAGRTGPVADILTLSVEDYMSTVAVDQHGILYGMRAVAPGMIAAGGGSIVNISSVAGILANGTSPNIGYTAAKFAVRGLTRQAAVDLGPRGVRVNCVLPGGVDTPLALAVRASRTAEENAKNLPPIGRSGRVEDLSQVVLFLATEESSFVSGADFVIDGGRSA